MFFITLTLYATIHLNMTSAIQKNLGGIKNYSSFEIKASKELESLGLFIFKDKKNNQIIEAKNAVSYYREIMGSTNPDEAEEGTIRRKYGISIDKNSVHGSDSVENAKIEINFFFKD